MTAGPRELVTLVRSRQWSPTDLAQLLGIEEEEASDLLALLDPEQVGIPKSEAAFMASLVDRALQDYFEATPDRAALKEILREALLEVAEGRPPPEIFFLPVSYEAYDDWDAGVVDPMPSRGRAALVRRLVVGTWSGARTVVAKLASRNRRRSGRQ